jgi:hypothetical protein
MPQLAWTKILLLTLSAIAGMLGIPLHALRID